MLNIKKIEFNHPNNSAFKICIESLYIKSSSITCILGENGSGKTTILNLIGGHLKPQKGQILLSDIDITEFRAEDRPVSTVFQQIGLFPHLTVKENIEIAIEPKAIFQTSTKTKEKASQFLENFNLTEFADRKPISLSIGQQQRVAIARSLSSSPKILLLDEPTSALDFTNINTLKKTLEYIKLNNIVPITIIVSHDLPFVLSVADEIKFINQGRLVFEGTTQKFQSSNWHKN